MADSLVKAYQTAIYSVESPQKNFTLKVGESCEPLIDLLTHAKVQTWAYVTAENPGSHLLTPQENAERSALLEKLLKEQGYLYYVGKSGSHDGSWPLEQSFLVLGILEADAVGLAQRYQQKALLIGGPCGVPVLKLLF